MVDFSKTMTVARTPEDVFGFMVDPANDPLWRESAGSFEWLTEETEGVGSRFRATDRLGWFSISYEVEVTHWEPPHVYGARSGGMATVEFTATLKPNGESATTVDLQGWAEFNGLLRVLGPVLGKQFTKQFGSEWDKLKQVLESPHHPTTDAA